MCLRASPIAGGPVFFCLVACGLWLFPFSSQKPLAELSRLARILGSKVTDRQGGPGIPGRAIDEFGPRVRMDALLIGLVEIIVSVKLRLKRFGRRNRSFYRLNAMDSRSPRDGRVIEQLGWYDPQAKQADKQISLNRERIEYWLTVGATPSDTVKQLLVKSGIPVKD